MDNIIIDSQSYNSIFQLRDVLYEDLLPISQSRRKIIILCIGTDRSTGDSLGPIIGNKLKFLNRFNIDVYGSLQQPVHAKNICDILDSINIMYSNPYVVAIDACLGHVQNIGKIIIDSKPILPGSALKKELPPIGNLSITGVVNISGPFEFMILQNTRLNTVFSLANVISFGIYHAIVKLSGNISNYNSSGNALINQ